ncbi:MAG: hypothetical protein WAU25_01330 [Nitrososphaeraceae archaeon]
MKLLIGVLVSILTSLIIALFVSYQIQSVDAQTVPSGECNCVLDSTSYASVPSSNVTGLTIPSVDLLKNEMVVSATEGNLSWVTDKGTELLGVLSENYFLGNFSRGTGRTVALNMLDIKQNESLGIEVSGGSLPDAMKAEIIQASVDKNGTLAEITTVGPKVAEVPIIYDETLEEPTTDKNNLKISVPAAGDYLLLVELSYDDKSPSASSSSSSKPLTLVYETVLVVE